MNFYAEDFADPEVLAHEYGHALLNLPDEYSEHPSAPFTRFTCGHSNMASPWGSNNNFCFIPGAYSDHERDGDHGAVSQSPYSAWTHMGSTFANKLFETGDNYDYRTHDFNGMIKVLRRN